jgi:uncharacterized membrane protein YcgQ (UPF0703/DUF1980 family)
MKNVLFTFLMLATVSVFAQSKTDAWNEFAKTKYEPKYLEKIGEYQFFPTFTPEVKALAGKEISIEGFYVPFAPEDGNYIILSRLPMSQCFFCGVGGPETIIEVNFKNGAPKFNNDDLVTVKGKLKLNADDIDHMNFILTDAVVVKK